MVESRAPEKLDNGRCPLCRRGFEIAGRELETEVVIFPERMLSAKACRSCVEIFLRDHELRKG